MEALRLPYRFDLQNNLDFELPSELEAIEPPEARGLPRDDVRLMVSCQDCDDIAHSQFRHLADFLEAGDVLAINTSGTMNAALKARREDGTLLELRLSTQLPAELWTVELRRESGTTTEPFRHARAGEVLYLPGRATAKLLTPYRDSRRLWIAKLDLPARGAPLHEYLDLHGFPIRYGYVREGWPLSYYQTAYVTEPGSA